MTGKTKVVKVFESFILGFCNCGCGTEIDIISSHYLRRYCVGHNGRGENNYFYGKNQKGPECVNWKGGRRKSRNYWLLWLPEYPTTRKDGCILEHIYFFQEYHKCCMLPWGVVHHIDPVRKNYCNNMPWNLQGMTRSQHDNYHSSQKKKDWTGTKCIECGSTETWINKKGVPIWRAYKDGYSCNKCSCIRYDNNPINHERKKQYMKTYKKPPMTEERRLRKNFLARQNRQKHLLERRKKRMERYYANREVELAKMKDYQQRKKKITNSQISG